MRSLPFCSLIYTCTLQIYSFIEAKQLKNTYYDRVRFSRTLEHYKVIEPENIEMRHLHYLGNSVNNDLNLQVSLIWCFFFILLGVFKAKSLAIQPTNQRAWTTHHWKKSGPFNFRKSLITTWICWPSLTINLNLFTCQELKFLSFRTALIFSTSHTKRARKLVPRSCYFCKYG